MKGKIFHYLIFVQALIAMLGSLYYGWYGDPFVNAQTGYRFSPLNGLAPCELCWYARILMYPIVLIGLIGIIRRSREYIYTVGSLALLGLGLEIFHYSLQKLDLTTGFTCTYANPCNALEVNYLGFITIPFLCGTAFLVILLSCIKIYSLNKK